MQVASLAAMAVRHSGVPSGPIGGLRWLETPDRFLYITMVALAASSTTTPLLRPLIALRYSGGLRPPTTPDLADLLS